MNFKEWRHIKYFAYEALCRRQQKTLLDEIMNISGASKKMRALKNKLYKDNDRGFYVLLFDI